MSKKIKIQSSSEINLEVIEHFEAVRLLINIYLIKKAKSLNRPISQERFINDVNREYKVRGYHYPKKRIEFTWKQLLLNYERYKKCFSDDKTNSSWPYFTLMNNCFDEAVQSSKEKFKDSKVSLCLIEFLKKHKPADLNERLSMDLLQAVEDDFRGVGNHEINQKDIYNQWIFLKQVYRHNKKVSKRMTKNDTFFNALKELFECEEDIQGFLESNKSKTVATQLHPGVEPINEEENGEIKRQKKDNLKKLQESSTPFTIVMHDILLLCFKKNKAKLKRLDGNVDSIIQEAYEEFRKLGYNVTQEAVANEWSDLSCRYEIIKNTKHPEKWPYYSDMNDIYNSVNLTGQSNEVEEQDNSSTIGSIIENLKMGEKLKSHGYAKLTERLLNVYESNSREFLEIKDIMIERNLLREETNYLLNVFVQKYNNKK